MLSDSPIRVVYECDGITRVWGFPVGEIGDASHVVVVLADEDGNEERLEAGYAVDLGARVVTCPLTGDPFPAGRRLAILREVPYTQEVDGSQRLTSLATLEEQLDRIVMQTQQLAEAVGRAVMVGVTDTTISVDDVLSFLRNSETQLDAVVAELAGAQAAMAAARDAALGDVEAARQDSLEEIGLASDSAMTSLSDFSVTAIDEMVGLRDAAAGSASDAAGSAAAALASANAAAESEGAALGSENAAADSERSASEYALAAAESASHAYAASAPPWDPSIEYVFPQTVAGNDGHTYRCTGVSQVGVPPSLDETNWTRLTAVTEGFFELDPEDGTGGSLMPSLVPGYSNEWTLDADGDIMPRL